MELAKHLQLEKQLKAEISNIKKFLVLGCVLLILAVAVQVFLAVIPFYIYWLLSGVKDPMFGALLFGLIALVIILRYIFRLFLFDFSKPEGTEVEEGSDLKKLIKDIAIKAKAPCPDYVYLSDDFNAFVSTYKSFFHPVGVHYLSIGIPYLAAVSKDELKSIIAHELGHLSKEHTNFSRFIYRVYNGLYKIDCVLNESPGIIDRWYHKGFSLYLKKLNKLSYATKRNHEFQADAIAASVTSPEITASALCRTEIVSDWMEDAYWKQVWRNSWQSAIPPENIIKRACSMVSKCDGQTMSKYLDVSKFKQTKDNDTHPSLSERLYFLGEKLNIPKEVKNKELAIHILGEDLENHIQKIDLNWQEEILEEWQNYHFYMSDCVMRRDMLDKLKAQRKLLIGEEIEYANLVGKTKGLINKLNELVKLHKTHRDNIWVLKLMLETLLDLKDKNVVNVAKILLKKGPLSFKKLALEVLLEHFKRIGDEEKITVIKQKLAEKKKIEEQRTQYKKQDLKMHALSAEKVKQIEQWLKTIGDIDFALICKVEDNNASGSPLHLLFISTPCYVEMGLSNKIWSGLDIPYDTLVIDADHQLHEKNTKHILQKFPGTRIFGDADYYLQ